MQQFVPSYEEAFGCTSLCSIFSMQMIYVAIDCVISIHLHTLIDFNLTITPICMYYTSIKLFIHTSIDINLILTLTHAYIRCVCMYMLLFDAL